MIVFLIANKISSFGIGDEEEERGCERERREGKQKSAGRREMDRPGCLHLEREKEREKDGDAPVLSCVAALVNVAMSTFCSDTGADGQFAPVSALAVLPHKRSAGAFRQPSTRTELTRAISN